MDIVQLSDEAQKQVKHFYYCVLNRHLNNSNSDRIVGIGAYVSEEATWLNVRIKTDNGSIVAGEFKMCNLWDIESVFKITN